jgi:hypothetical protein
MGPGQAQALSDSGLPLAESYELMHAHARMLMTLLQVSLRRFLECILSPKVPHKSIANGNPDSSATSRWSLVHLFLVQLFSANFWANVACK